MKNKPKKPSRKKTNKVSKLKGCDDCPICKAMKDGSADSLKGLMKTFKKAEEEADFLGGNMTMRTPNKDDLYYDAMDALNDYNDFKTAEKLLLEAKEMDPNYVQTYVGLVSVYARPKDRKKLEENIKKAFDLTVKEFSKWPKKLEWGYLENRAYLRVIQYRADIHIDDGEKDKAEELYRLILKLNPHDNQGVRYVLAGMFAGISGAEVNKMFEYGNKKQDWSKLEKLVETQNNKHRFWKEK